MLREQAEVLKDPNSTQAKLFRRRFRVPYPLFLLYVEWTTDELESMPPLAGWPPVPMTLKVLGVPPILRMGPRESLTVSTKTKMKIQMILYCVSLRLQLLFKLLLPSIPQWPCQLLRMLRGG
jgi:hypothetical protein